VSNETLKQTIRDMTGDPFSMPRLGQGMLNDDVVKAMIAEDGHVAGEAPTGSGKSFALLAAAMELAAQGMRSVISTESLSLQAQILSKDAPMCAPAAKKVTGYEPSFAVLKGFSNYLCKSKAETTYVQAVGSGSGDTITIDGRPVGKKVIEDLLRWTKRLPDSAAGDRQSYDGELDENAWGLVSVASTECVKASCKFFEECKPLQARGRAAEADIVITNHSLLAVQAAKGVPAILSNKTLGEFHALMIDEAHALPDAIRAQGTTEISGAVLRGLSRLLSQYDDGDRATQYADAGRVLAGDVEAALTAFGAGIPEGESKSLTGDMDPFDEGTWHMLDTWAGACKQLLKRGSDDRASRKMQSQKLRQKFEDFQASLKQLADHRVGVARWVKFEQPPAWAKRSDPYPVMQSALVNIAPLMKSNLYRVEVEPDPEEVQAQRELAALELGGPGEGEAPEKVYRDIAVIAISATMPQSYARETGMKVTRLADYPSPFEKAYGASLMVVAKPSPDEVAALTAGGFAGKPKFNPTAHRDWVARGLPKLFDANGGSGLVLAANGSNGAAYAESLREHARGRWNVYSQWDGIAHVVDRWRDDETSILVGAKSFMTGVDAKGRTCSVVAIDRVPRKPSNTMDNARVEQIMAELNCDKWSAEVMVYVSDAANLLGQEAGRLIRSESDYGVVAVFDFRLLATLGGGKNAVAYKEATRRVYKHALRRFPRVSTSLDEAASYLAEHRYSTPHAA
jgi:ATP-dependent DNA helicase DinG